MVRWVGIALILVALPGCQNNSESDAAAKVERYLYAAAGNAPDRGWSLLLPADREQVYGDRDAYLAEAEASDWEVFSWEYVDAHCDDGVCAVWFHVPSRGAIPDVLARGPVLYREQGVPEGANVWMMVTQRGPFGDGVTVWNQ